METATPNRLDRFREGLAGEALDAFLVTVEENRRYLSGFTGEDTQFDESAGALLVTRRHAILLTDSRYDLQARREAPGWEVRRTDKGLADALPGLLRELNAGRVGFESVRMTVLQHDKIRRAVREQGVQAEWEPREGLVERLRARKDPGEVGAIRRSLRLAEKAFTALLEGLESGTTEREAAWRLESILREAGAEGLAFPVIAASGPSSALPHAVPGDRRIRPGEPLLFDWGARLDGYCSDISRTVFPGRPDATFQRVFRTVLEAQEKAVEAIRPGASGKEVDRVARDHIDRAGFPDRFGHSLGHGVGLAVHEGPRLSPLREDVLEEGMVVTVEPGIYLPEWGGVRLENLVVVRGDGAEVLNDLPAELPLDWS